MTSSYYCPSLLKVDSLQFFLLIFQTAVLSSRKYSEEHWNQAIQKQTGPTRAQSRQVYCLVTANKPLLHCSYPLKKALLKCTLKWDMLLKKSARMDFRSTLSIQSGVKSKLIKVIYKALSKLCCYIDDTIFSSFYKGI